MRPAFVWALALIAVPILVLFGFGFMNDIDGSMRLVMAPTYVLGAWVAPVVLARRLVGRGAPLSDAVAAALGLGVAVLALDLSLLAGTNEGARELVFLIARVGLVLGIVVWDRTGGTGSRPARRLSDNPRTGGSASKRHPCSPTQPPGRSASFESPPKRHPPPPPPTIRVGRPKRRPPPNEEFPDDGLGFFVPEGFVLELTNTLTVVGR